MNPPTTPKVHNVDPNGDLILRVGEALASAALPQPLVASTATPRASFTLIRVSSKILTLVSPVFNAMLNGNFREGQLRLSTDSPPYLDLPEDNPFAMLLMCRVLHYHAKTTNRTIDMVFIADIAKLADKYGCASACQPWFRAQLLVRGKGWLKRYGPVIGYIIRAAYDFGDRDVFHLSTMFVIKSFSQRALKQIQPAMEDSIPEAFIFNMFSNVQQEQLWLLSDKCQDEVARMMEYRSTPPPAPDTIASRAGDQLKLPDLCKGNSNKIATFIAALSDAGLWRNKSPAPDNVSIADLMEEVERIGRTLDKSDRCCDFQTCPLWDQSWDDVTAQIIKNFKDDLYGLCLDCVTRSAASDELPLLSSHACDQHKLPNRTFMSFALY